MANLSPPPADSECAAVSATLTALASAVQGDRQAAVALEPMANRQNEASTFEATLVAIGGAVRQQADEIQKIEARVELANQKAESAAARFGALESLAAHLRQMMEKLDEASVSANSAQDQMKALSGRIDDLERRLAATDASFQTAIQDQGRIAGSMDARLAQSEQLSKSNSEVNSGLASRLDAFERRFEDSSAALFSALQQQAVKLQCMEELLKESMQQEAPAAQPAAEQSPEPAEAAAEAGPIVETKPEGEVPAPAAEDLDDVRDWAAGGKRKSRKRLIWTTVAASLLLAGFAIYEMKDVVEVYLYTKPAPPAPVKTTVPPPPLPAVQTEPPAAAAPEEPTGNAPQKVSVVVTAEEDSWVEAEADGKKVFAKLVQANQTRSFDASRQLMIRTGNLAGVTASHNGRPIGKLGNVHSAGRVLFTPAGWQPM